MTSTVLMAVIVTQSPVGAILLLLHVPPLILALSVVGVCRQPRASSRGAKPAINKQRTAETAPRADLPGVVAGSRTSWPLYLPSPRFAPNKELTT